MMLLLFGASSYAFANCTDIDSSDCPPQQPLLTIEASFAELPYGQVWDVRYGGGEEVGIEISSPPPRFGTISGTVSLASEDSASLRKVIGEQRFFELTNHIASGYPLHRPKLMLRIRLGEKTRTVDLYDPVNSKSHPESARFLAVWDKFFALLPVHPSWE